MTDPAIQDRPGVVEAQIPPFPHTSEMLLALLERAPYTATTLAELTAGLMNRVLGFVMILFAVPCIVPMPPGIPFLCGLVLLSCGIHLLIGRETMWLPRFVARRSIRRAVLERIVARTVPVARRLERLCRPRWTWLTSRPGRACIGAVVVILSLILLPIPLLGNLPPGVAIAILALGFIERDGLVIAVGIVTSAAAVAINSLTVWAATCGLNWLV